MKKVFVQLESGRGYGRDILKGIYDYNHKFSGWEIIFEPAYYLKTSGTNEVGKLVALLKPDGCILESINTPLITQLGIPLIQANSIGALHNQPYLRGDYEADAKVAIDYFLSKGFKQLAFFGVEDLAWSDRRYKSFKTYAKKYGFTVYKYLMKVKSKKGLEHDFENIISWLTSVPKPIGVLCCNDDFGQILINACSIGGLEIPHEVAVLGIDNDELLCNITHPKLSSISRNHSQAAFNACKVLDQMMKGVRIENLIIPTEPIEVIERTSTDTIASDDIEVTKALQFIRNSVHLNIKVGDVVDATSISRRSLYTRFKKVTNKTILEEIQFQKLKKFKELLKNEKLSIKEIAFRLGFQDITHVSRWFSSIEGIAPIKWRNENIGV